MAILDTSDYQSVEINHDELRIETTRGTGNGGQHKNTTDSCVVMTHTPTGIKVVRDGRSQHANKDDAYKEIKKRVNEYYRNNKLNSDAEFRRDQIGDGSRSDKRRTYKEKEGTVIDHITNKKANIKDILKGKINLLS